MENDIWHKIKKHIHNGDRVAELYHGEKDDILMGLSYIVGTSGVVFGIDKLNPFSHYQNMSQLQNIPNIELIKARIPPLPEKCSNLDAIIIREFIWTFDFVGGEIRVNNNLYSELNSAIKNNGYLILVLNKPEKRQESEDTLCLRIIERYFQNFINISHEGYLIVSQKSRLKE